jgi:hypothetical protein
VVLRKKLAVLLAMVMMLGVMSAAGPVALAEAGGNLKGNKALDGADANQGGGQERTKNARPPHGGGECHAGGCAGGGSG